MRIGKWGKNNRVLDLMISSFTSLWLFSLYSFQEEYLLRTAVWQKMNLACSSQPCNTELNVPLQQQCRVDGTRVQMTTCVMTLAVWEKVLNSKVAFKISLTVDLMKPQQSLLIIGSVVANNEVPLGSPWHNFWSRMLADAIGFCQVVKWAGNYSLTKSVTLAFPQRNRSKYSSSLQTFPNHSLNDHTTQSCAKKWR